MPAEALTFYDVQRDLGTRLVEVNRVGHIFAKKGERSAIATHGLGSCTAVAVQFEVIDNPAIRGTLIAHYPPSVVSLIDVENDIRMESDEILQLGVVAKALIVSPGREDPRSPTAHSPQSEELDRIQILTDTLKRVFGEQTTISKVGYRPPRNRGWIKGLPEPRDRGTVLVEYTGDHVTLKVDGFEIP